MLAFEEEVGYLRPYRDEHTASRPIREVKHRRGQRVLPWVTRREHCAAAGFFFFFWLASLAAPARQRFKLFFPCW